MTDTTDPDSSTDERVAVTFTADNAIEEIHCDAGLSAQEIATLVEWIDEDPLWLQSSADRAADLPTSAWLYRDELAGDSAGDSGNDDSDAPEGWVELSEGHMEGNALTQFKGGFRKADQPSTQVHIYKEKYTASGEPPFTIIADEIDGEGQRKRTAEDFEAAKEQARQLAASYGETDDDDAPDGWNKVGQDHRHSWEYWFRGGYAHADEPLEIQVWEAPTGEGGHVFPDEDQEEDQTEAPRYEVKMVREPDSRDEDTLREKRGFEDDPEGAKEKAREWAAEYTAEEVEA